ncbi:DUF488 domain-containing protein [Tenacibaculum sp. IMCC1]|uniref:DUF488 domain-containing protein n=1 Tax=Tenacibaculum sp. Pbs-1 TaxID=3238748 RepID=A0AB33KZS4_9FLAO
MFYRRKFALALVQKFGGELDNLKFQKLLFLATRKQDKKSFDFVPYKFGCFSFQANQDMITLVNRNFLSKDNNNWIVKDDDNYFALLNEVDKRIINVVHSKYSNYSGDELIKETYVNYPFYASKSTIAKKVLSEDELNKVEKQKRSYDDEMFFTIGYEGVSLETYLNKLIINDVKVLVDVRKNSISMKYGFSKSQLKNACESIGIKFMHIPELGIESEKRQELNSLKDYKKLFDVYKKTTLKANDEYLLKLKDISYKYKRVAITCFEKEVCMCHRGVVADELKNKKDWNIKLKHL